MLGLYPLLSGLSSFFFAGNTTRCTSLKSLRLENTTILDASYFAAGSSLPIKSACQSTGTSLSTASICRVQGVVDTSPTSAVHIEVWLPDEWFGRFLALGNRGLAGCIQYGELDYGSTLHFATIASDNGHTGSFVDGTAFLHQPEHLNDFASRAIHVETLLGKQIIAAYYGHAPFKSYYLGCSMGGRQGIQSALQFPADFDGILAGAPAVDFNNLVGWDVMLGLLTGAPHSPLIPAALWPVISQEILDQCDGLDGVRDGIITDPDVCTFRPEELLCTAGATSGCLTPPQVAVLRRIYVPLHGTDGQVLYPQYDLGAEADGAFAHLFNGEIFAPASDWFKYAVFNDTNYAFDNFNVHDVEFANAINPGGVATWDGDLSAFRSHGGKILTYHGRGDGIIPSSVSIRMYDLISSTLSLPRLDDFYRLFLIPGMAHCDGGPGAWAFGQSENSFNKVNDSSHNALLALVDWVEDYRAPDVIVGSGTKGERTHCRYPQRSVFDGREYVCQ